MLREYIQELEKKEFGELCKELEDLSESFHIVNSMVSEQGEKIDLVDKNIQEAEENVEIGTKSLENAAKYTFISRKKIRNVAIVVGTLTAGAFGFIAGPLIGIGTTISGLAAGLGIVSVAEKNS